MDNKILNYKAEDLLEDREFVRWALNGSNDNEWSKLISEYPDFASEVYKAKEIALLMKDKSVDLNIDDVQTMWKNIEHYQILLQGKNKPGFIRKIVRYAAVILITVSLGTIAYLYFSGQSRSYKFASGNSIIKSGDAKLILSDGEEINLKKDYSSVVVKDDKSIVINNEQSIDLQKQETATEKNAVMNEVVIPYGKKTQLTLADGTKVWLDAGSRLAFPNIFTGAKREVYLEGEAYFEVAHNPDKPFIVNAKDVSLKVLGTRFLLSAYSSDEEVLAVLMEGSVAIKDNAPLRLSRNEIVMEPGQKANYNKNSRKINVEKVEDMDFYVAWTEGWFEFNRENLFTVFNKLKRYYNVNFIYDKSFPSDDLISGKLDLKDSISDVMATISSLSNISYKINQNDIFINKKQE